jgi:hypothetical protein
MAAADWPGSAPMPVRQSVSPAWDSIRPQSPFTGSVEPAIRFHQWRARCSWNALPIDGAQSLSSHFGKSRAGETVYKIPIMLGRRKRGSKTGSVTLSGSHAAGVRNLTITGGGGTFNGGDWIWINQTTNVPFAYLVTTAESGGVIGINPGLRGRTSYGGGTIVHHIGNDSEIYDTMELASDAPEFMTVEVGPTPYYTQPWEAEFVTALRRSY